MLHGRVATMLLPNVDPIAIIHYTGITIGRITHGTNPVFPTTERHRAPQLQGDLLLLRR